MKYLELIKGQFTADHEARAKQEEPYVAYSEEADTVMYNFIPQPVVGPADNEIWYTSINGKVVAPYAADVFGANIVSNTYKDGKGVITFDGPVKSIGDGAFYSNAYLSSITIPNSVTSIVADAFCGCISLTSITIPNRVTSIGDRAFEECMKLTSITFEGTMEEWNDITKGDDWNYAIPATYVQCTDGQVAL